MCIRDRFARTAIFPEDASETSYVYQAGTDEDGNRVGYGYFVAKNIAGFYLCFRCIESESTISKDELRPFKKRKAARATAARRADQWRAARGKEQIWTRYWESK